MRMPFKLDDTVDTIMSVLASYHNHERLGCQLLENDLLLIDNIIKEIKRLRSVVLSIMPVSIESNSWNDLFQSWRMVFLSVLSIIPSCKNTKERIVSTQRAVECIRSISGAYKTLCDKLPDNIFPAEELAWQHPYLVELRKSLEKRIVDGCRSALDIQLFGITMQCLWDLLICRLNLLSTKDRQIVEPEQMLKFVALFTSLQYEALNMEPQGTFQLSKNVVLHLRHCSYLFSLAETNCDLRDAINSEAYDMLQNISLEEKSHSLKCVDHILEKLMSQPSVRGQIFALLNEMKLILKFATISESLVGVFEGCHSKFVRAICNLLHGSAGSAELQVSLAEVIDILRSLRMQCTRIRISPTYVIEAILSFDHLSCSLEKLESSQFVAEVKHSLKSIKVDMEFLGPLLNKISENKMSQNTTLQDIMCYCINIPYDVEGMVDTLLENKSLSRDSILSISSILEQIAYIKSEISKREDGGLMSELIQQVGSQIATSQESESSNVYSMTATSPPFLFSNSDFTGFESELTDLMDMIMMDLPYDVISIVGMPGLGKTTLTQKVYNHESFVDLFDVRLWCTVSQGYNRRQLLLKLLIQLNGNMNSADPALEVRQKLSGKKFLIVLDDVWSTDTWDDILSFLPMQSNGSRIVLTSRYTEVAEHAKTDSEPYHLPLRTSEQSWQLLMQQVFQKSTCPPELLDVGCQIAKKCHGLPLIVSLVAGLLINVEKNMNSWKEILDRLKLKGKDAYDCVMSTVEHSFEHLPSHLKLCLLYVAAFREDEDICVAKLLRIWTAEKFVSTDVEADNCVNDLTRRNLVIGQIGSAKTLKTIHVHDLIHEFCLTKAKEENFLLNSLYRKFSSTGFGPRRWCSYDDIGYIDEKKDSLLRTLILYRADEYAFRYSDSIYDFRSFKLLRVLDLDRGTVVTTSDFDLIFQLIHLRYLAINSLWEIRIDSSIANLQKLDTLALFSSERVIISSKLWDITTLRHLRVRPALFVSGDSFNGCSRLINLESIMAVPISYWENVGTVNLPALRKLSICDWENVETVDMPTPIILSALRKLGFWRPSSSDKYSAANTNYTIRFLKFDALSKLEKLKIECRIRIGGRRSLSPPCEWSLPSNLRKLTLVDTRFSWSEFTRMGEFPKLEVLKLENGSHSGETWETEAANFPSLKYLKMRNMYLLHWTFSGEPFRKLEHLVLVGCNHLEEIPSEFEDVYTLERIEVHLCKQSVGDSALRIQEELRDIVTLRVVVNTEDFNVYRRL